MSARRSRTFRELIENIRKLHGAPLPVEIVTDGSAHELGELPELPNVSMAPADRKSPIYS
jgi:hypothetical protein